jgi:hypothetical protein
MKGIKKGDIVIYKGKEVFVMYCSLNKVRIKGWDEKEHFVSYQQLTPK